MTSSRRERPPAPAASAAALLGRALDETLHQLRQDSAALASADAGEGGECVHRLRVGIRRLRSLLRTFEGWVPAPPQALIDDLRAWFAALGRARERQVLAEGVSAALAAAGAPPLAPERGSPGPLLQHEAPQALLASWQVWRMEALAGESADASGDAPLQPARAARRLARWHRRLAVDARAFASLDDAAMHALRKRVKRQRYALEGLAPLLKPRRTARYLAALVAAQQALGELNDLFVARAHYQARLAREPAAWFALGWLAARIADARRSAAPRLRRLARAAPPAAVSD